MSLQILTTQVTPINLKVTAVILLAGNPVDYTNSKGPAQRMKVTIQEVGTGIEAEVQLFGRQMASPEMIGQTWKFSLSSKEYMGNIEAMGFMERLVSQHSTTQHSTTQHSTAPAVAPPAPPAPPVAPGHTYGPFVDEMLKLKGLNAVAVTSPVAVPTAAMPGLTVAIAAAQAAGANNLLSSNSDQCHRMVEMIAKAITAVASGVAAPAVMPNSPLPFAVPAVVPGAPVQPVATPVPLQPHAEAVAAGTVPDSDIPF